MNLLVTSSDSRTNRFDRGLNFFLFAREKARELGFPFNWNLKTIARVGHNNAGFGLSVLKDSFRVFFPFIYLSLVYLFCHFVSLSRYLFFFFLKPLYVSSAFFSSFYSQSVFPATVLLLMHCVNWVWCKQGLKSRSFHPMECLLSQVCCCDKMILEILMSASRGRFLCFFILCLVFFLILFDVIIFFFWILLGSENMYTRLHHHELKHCTIETVRIPSSGWCLVLHGGAGVISTYSFVSRICNFFAKIFQSHIFLPSSLLIDTSYVLLLLLLLVFLSFFLSFYNKYLTDLLWDIHFFVQTKILTL